METEKIEDDDLVDEDTPKKDDCSDLLLGGDF